MMKTYWLERMESIEIIEKRDGYMILRMDFEDMWNQLRLEMIKDAKRIEREFDDMKVKKQDGN